MDQEDVIGSEAEEVVFEPAQVVPEGTAEEDEADDTPLQINAKSTESMRILEAILFASSEILPLARIKTLLPEQPDGRIIKKMIAGINERLQKERHPFEIGEVGGGYQFRTIPYYQPWVQQLFKEKSNRKLSIQALETLAIIAYKQPITKAEVEQIRGVISDGAMKTLLEKRLVTIAGRSEKAGHPLLYGTTPSFLQYFGINRIVDLPRIEEFESIARQKMEELSEDELRTIDSLPPAEEGEPQPSDQSSTEAPLPSSGTPGDDTVEQSFTQIVADAEMSTELPAQPEAPTSPEEGIEK